LPIFSSNVVLEDFWAVYLVLQMDLITVLILAKLSSIFFCLSSSLSILEISVSYLSRSLIMDVVRKSLMCTLTGWFGY